MSAETDQDRLIATADALMITRREAIQRVTALLGGFALVGGNALLTGCRDPGGELATGAFTAADIAFLDEVADTILPETGTPGAKAAGVGAFMAHMVIATYAEPEQQIFREGMRALDEASRSLNGDTFMRSTPEQRLALLEQLDREQKAMMDARQEARTRRRLERYRAADAAAGAAPAPGGAAPPDAAGDPANGAEADAFLPDERQENTPGAEAAGAAAITADTPTHYFRMMKELALLGYFTSEIGYMQAMRYVESPGRYDPCTPYAPGDRAWAPHA